MSRWWRAYDEAIDDPKLVLLSDRAHRAWFNLCCLTSASGGALPEMKILAVKLRMPPAKITKLLAELKQGGLIDEDEAGLRPHNWSGRQFKSDVTDPTNATRQKRYRDRYATVTDGVTDKRPETEEQKQKEEDIAASAAPSTRYAFEQGVIRLAPKDLEKWKKAFSYLDLEAELIALAPWAADQQSWFNAVSAALAKRNREMMSRAEKSQSAPVRLAPNGKPWPAGVEW